ncbi:MAG: hypothetical protein QGG36_04145 [Pirellulaceae bacterium]|jgi:tetratricopeptide (TPR) repeat protein|nr:hypothetical protein [Pirellulaceae bacterium]MDP7014961.1 hypothetical protein [Pirellulaceae bacterium]
MATTPAQSADFDLPELQPPAVPAWLTPTLTLITCAIALGPLYNEPRFELARWQLAIGGHHAAEGDYPAAIEQASAALETAPDLPAVLLHRALWRNSALGDYQSADPQAIEDLNLLLLRNPKNTDALQRRASLLQTIGEHERAIDDHRRALRVARARPDSQLNRARVRFALNGLAYSRAVANRDLDEALQEIQEATRNSPSVGFGMLDTRAFIRYRRGEIELALADMHAAIADMDDKIEIGLYDKRGDDLAAAMKGEGVRLELLADERLAAQETKRNLHTQAVLYYHRALIRRAARQARGAKADIERVRQLGARPDDSLQ